MKELYTILLCLVVATTAQYSRRHDPRSHPWRNYAGYRNDRLSRPRRMGVMLSGPNVCTQGGQKYCCPGWMTARGSNKCLLAVCSNNCGDGICVQPNQCLCSNGILSSQCGEPIFRDGDRCPLRCMNGGSCKNMECRCTSGFTGAHCGQPICGPGCLNGGRCVEPGRCLCTYGFTGDRCQTDYRVGPCFLTRANDTCMDEIPGVACRKKLCCATIGQGWGIPCEECAARVGNCSRGRMPPHCDDINECKLIPGLCKDGECVNTDGSFRCECPSGYTYNTRLHICEDINECELGYCENGMCTNTVGAYMCVCGPDYRLSADGSYCIYDAPGFCYTSIESGMCADPLDRMQRRTECCCKTVGTVEQETLGKCFAVPDGVPERCPTLGTPEFIHQCDVDNPDTDDGGDLRICQMMNKQACRNGTCIPKGISDFECQCDPGFTLTANRKDCIDINECGDVLGGSNVCGEHGTCMNTEGGYQCHCDAGFMNTPDGRGCVDIDECDLNDGELRCGGTGDCVNTKGSFICYCHEGYEQTATQQGCIDTNECIMDADLCEFGRCLNIVGSWKCVCNPGFVPSDNGRTCVDENECEATGMCEHGQCVNRNGGFDCMCDNGYEQTPDGKHCKDVDECINKPCINGRCENTDGDFICHCHKFQVLDDSGRRCVLEPRTANCYRNVRNGQCSEANALVQLTTRAECCCTMPGGLSAWDQCDPCPELGSSNHAILCANEIPNPCDMQLAPCSNGACINMERNNFRCECNTGFIPASDGKSCRDIDECSENMMLCSNGQCRNTPGSFVCTCDNGFILNGDVCEDVNECHSSPCIDGDCVNTPGSFICSCDEASTLDIHGLRCYSIQLQQCWKTYENTTCSDNLPLPLTSEQCCNSIGQAWGNQICTPCSELSSPCPHGYMYDVASDKCIDIPECIYDVCDDKAECQETDGSFICVCPSHLTLDDSGLFCIDLRMGQCFFEYDEENEACDRPSMAAVMRKADCCCTTGKGWGDPCEGCPVEGTTEFEDLCRDAGHLVLPTDRVNECVRFPDICENGICKNTVDSYECICNNGFTLDLSGRFCNDIPECDISTELCSEGNGTCINTEGSFRCDCNEGYVVSPDGTQCENQNECIAGGKCTGGECHDTQGSYFCTCPQGRALNDDGTRCVDVDECSVMNDLCEPNGQCVNMLGFFMCVCNPGFMETEDKTNCIDIDECEYENGGCSTICINTIGSYECRCEEGFTLTYDGHTCADVDECLEQPNRCDGGRCENREGGFVCVCFDGFMATMELDFCNDIDECAMNPNICLNGLCHNTRGSYTCNCDPGYCVPQGQMICKDEDECELGKHTCDVNADCSNTDGSFTCECIPGFTGDGYECDDFDECLNGNHTCDVNADCRNTLGTYECDCIDGFHGDGFSCSDKDDCLEDENLCGPYGECLNIQGSFECECSMGFMTTADMKACKDIDECAIEHICENGRCHNVPGTFRCDCLTGFEKDEQGANCTDINECDDVANCINGECVNTIGSYECKCPVGFTPNPSGVGCVDTRTGDCFLTVDGDLNAPVCSHAIGINVARASCCCNSYAQGWGNPCEFCPERNTSEYMTLCPGGDGFRPNPITVFLEDIDECMELPGLCQGGTCINVFGSFLCECKEGYVLNEVTRVCEDYDECTEAENVCGSGTCVNSVGGYSCLCPDGYRPINRGRICEDERMANCFKFYNETSLQCTDSLFFNTTKKLCCCNRGIGSGWNHPCEVCPVPGDEEFLDLCHVPDYIKDARICQKLPDLCLNGECVNTDTEAGYRCECPMGYRFNEGMLICEDIDECANGENDCVENAQCVNLEGTYRCNCRDGFRGSGDKECTDIDECLEEGACANGACSNTEGGFICECDQGFRPINGDEACDDVDECLRDPCGEGTCQNMIGSFVCSCNNGFTLSDNGDCVDIDECTDNSACRNGTCDNEPGSFSCICDDGYEVSRDGRACMDVNECREDPTICGIGTCTNLDGSHKCFCPTGYSNGDGRECIDDDECEAGDMCKGGECINTPGSFTCVCPPNHVLSSNKKYCIDQTRGHCFRDYDRGTCANTMPTLVMKDVCCCRCIEAGWGEDEGSCEECPKEGTTEFDEICPYGCGATLDGTEINECITNNPCINGKCRNLAGGFKCECREGYRLDDTGLRCIDENECEEWGNPCGAGSCVNREGGFECSCEPGYYNGPRMSCIDIDECAEPVHGCKFRCVNTDGSYVCTCPDGFTLSDDERSCTDVDECSDPDLNRCEENEMICKNQIGYFDCLCQPGYSKVGALDVCENVDECAQTGVCVGGECIDEEGSYRCRCDEGYEYDEQGRRCIDRRLGFCYAAVHQRTCEMTATTHIEVSKTDCCCNRGKGWGPDCDLCPPPSSKEYVKLCPHGPGFNERGEDIDDCVVIPGLCVNGTCTNLLGSFKCICDRGFMPTESMQACIDIDECLMPNGCAGGSQCRNTIGGYKCECPIGYQITNTMRCVDVDECASKGHACQFICINTIGSYHCGCPHGFAMHMNESCVDKDECKTDADICGQNADCVNDVGGYHCVCKAGYEKTPNGDGCVGLPCDSRPGVCGPQMCMNMGGDGIRCVPGCNPNMHLRFNPMRCYDISDCRNSPCRLGSRCAPNEQGQFRCGCGRGFAMMGRGCGDINECRFQRNPCQYGCNNNYGGFRCGCPQGFFGVGGGHCMNGYRGFQQPSYPPYGGGYGGGGQSRCYDCPPVGPHRSRRSANVVMEEIRSDDNNNTQVDASSPILLHANLEEVTTHTPLIRLMPSLRTLQDHIKYRITSGNKKKMFRMHRDETGHFIHLGSTSITPGSYRIKVEARPTLDHETAKRASLNNEEIENAMEQIVKLDIEFDFEK